MTTQSTSIQARTRGRWIFIGATAASLAVLGAALLGQLRPSGETGVPQPTRVAAGTTEAANPTGGLAELYGEAEWARAARGEAARLERLGGMAELYREQALTSGVPGR